MKKLNLSVWLVLLAITLTSCASLRKAELASGKDPHKAISEVNAVMLQAQQEQVDVLADDQFLKGKQFLMDAQLGLKQGDLLETVLDNAAIAKALFEDAGKTAQPRRSVATRILEARASALAAGVRKSPPLVKSLLEIDEDLKSETKNFKRSLEPEDFAELQKKYLVLESRAVQFSELNSAKQVIKQAEDNNADDLAPESLRVASLDYKTAMNIIAQSPRSPSIYKKSVDEALASATLLYDVMNVIMGAKGTPENIAKQIVKQKRQLGELSTNVGKLQQNLESAKQNLESTKQTLEAKEGALQKTQSELQQREGVIKSQEEQLARASTQVRFQQAMEEARKELPEDDALVYQQGNKLVFRLKRVNFQSGEAVIPEFSKLLIAKVNGIIKKLDAEKVIVQGHTDSVGSDQINKKLSQDRAKAVANYLFSFRGGYKITYIGYGESHPIAPNETASGRATNRRVDLVVSVKQ